MEMEFSSNVFQEVNKYENYLKTLFFIFLLINSIKGETTKFKHIVSVKFIVYP